MSDKNFGILEKHIHATYKYFQVLGSNGGHHHHGRYSFP
jgi:hypothetical protein